MHLTSEVLAAIAGNCATSRVGVEGEDISATDENNYSINSQSISRCNFFCNGGDSLGPPLCAAVSTPKDSDALKQNMRPGGDTKFCHLVLLALKGSVFVVGGGTGEGESYAQFLGWRLECQYTSDAGESIAQQTNFQMQPIYSIQTTAKGNLLPHLIQDANEYP
eukprot:996884-Amphidinium_carterae.1